MVVHDEGSMTLALLRVAACLIVIITAPAAVLATCDSISSGNKFSNLAAGPVAVAVGKYPVGLCATLSQDAKYEGGYLDTTATLQWLCYKQKPTVSSSDHCFSRTYGGRSLMMGTDEGAAIVVDLLDVVQNSSPMPSSTMVASLPGTPPATTNAVGLAKVQDGPAGAVSTDPSGQSSPTTSTSTSDMTLAISAPASTTTIASNATGSAISAEKAQNAPAAPAPDTGRLNVTGGGAPTPPGRVPDQGAAGHGLEPATIAAIVISFFMLIILVVLLWIFLRRREPREKRAIGPSDDHGRRHSMLSDAGQTNVFKGGFRDHAGAADTTVSPISPSSRMLEASYLVPPERSSMFGVVFSRPMSVSQHHRGIAARGSTVSMASDLSGCGDLDADVARQIAQDAQMTLDITDRENRDSIYTIRTVSVASELDIHARSSQRSRQVSVADGSGLDCGDEKISAVDWAEYHAAIGVRYQADAERIHAPYEIAAYHKWRHLRDSGIVQKRLMRVSRLG